MIYRLFSATFFVLLIALPAMAQWPDRHGPARNSHAGAEDTQGLPVQWSETQNIAWKTALHDQGHSSPVVLEGKVWLTAATLDGLKQYVLGIDESSGELLHDILLFENAEVEPLGGAQGYNNYAAPSCVLAPGAVFAHFGSYGTARLDAKTGQVVWQRRDLPCRHYRGPGSSPVLEGGRLVLTFDGVDQQYTTVLDARTGATLWRTDRSTDYGDLDANGLPIREGDLRKAYCTPEIARIGDRLQILSVGSRAMHSYDLTSGRELWSLRHTSYNAAIRPLWLDAEQLVVINTGSRAAQMVAVRVDETTSGDVTDTHVVWQRKKGNPRFAKPIYRDGRIYQVSDIGVASCIDAATGQELWKDRIPGDYRSSPILAGNRMYLFSEQGRGTVVQLGNAIETLAVNEVPGMGTTASPAVSRGALFVRGRTHLYKIARGDGASE